MKRTLQLCIIAFALTLQANTDKISYRREQIALDLKNEEFASRFSGLIFLSDEMELSGANYTIKKENEILSDIKLKTIAMPFRTRFTLFKKQKIYVEGVLGLCTTDQSASDIYLGALPGHETSIYGEMKTISGLLGIGPEFKLTDGLTVTPIIDTGISYIRSDAEYGGPGAEETAEYFDGLAFNWEGWTTTGGGSIRLDWIKYFGLNYKLETIARYNIRWTKTFHTDSYAQDFTSRLQLLTLHSDLIGPTTLAPFNRTLYWRAQAGYRYFLEDSLYGVRYIILLGLGLEYDIKNILPIGSRGTLKGGIMLGDNISGYTFGIGMTF